MYTLERSCFLLELRIGCMVIGILGIVAATPTVLPTGTRTKEGASTDPEHLVHYASIGLYLIANLFLVYGAWLGVPKALLPYLIFALIYVTWSVFYMIMSKADTSHLIVTIFWLVLSLYFMLVVYSHYVELSEG